MKSLTQKLKWVRAINPEPRHKGIPGTDRGVKVLEGLGPSGVGYGDYEENRQG